jgi:hypothetical protein
MSLTFKFQPNQVLVRRRPKRAMHPRHLTVAWAIVLLLSHFFVKVAGERLWTTEEVILMNTLFTIWILVIVYIAIHALSLP